MPLRRVPLAGLPSSGGCELTSQHPYGRKRHSGPTAHRDGIFNRKESACKWASGLANVTTCSVANHIANG